jgi:hypothetical protein
VLAPTELVPAGAWTRAVAGQPIVPAGCCKAEATRQTPFPVSVAMVSQPSASPLMMTRPLLVSGCRQRGDVGSLGVEHGDVEHGSAAGEVVAVHGVRFVRGAVLTGCSWVRPV